jgi:hypothetical protein
VTSTLENVHFGSLTRLSLRTILRIRQRHRREKKSEPFQMFPFTVCNEAVTGCRSQSLQCVSTIACILSEAKHKLIAAVHPQIHCNMPFPGKCMSQNEPWEISVGATLSKEAGDEIIEQAVRRCPASSNSVLSRQRRHTRSKNRAYKTCEHQHLTTHVHIGKQRNPCLVIRADGSVMRIDTWPSHTT